MYDVAFSVSITDEILNFEPLEDKFCVLRKKQMQSQYQVFENLRSRISFFSIYNLFDVVEHNYLDNQAISQKILIHMKKQETEINRLNEAVKTMACLLPLSDIIQD